MLRPVLRADLVPADGALHDPVFDRRIELGPSTAALAAALDGRTAAELTGGQPRAERILRRFMLLEMIEGVSPEIVNKMRALRNGTARLAHAVLAGARFACQGSGACCQGHRLGPLSDADVALLARQGVADAVIELPRDHGTARYLRQVDGRCSFLLPDDRCGLHARFGAAGKPGFCRSYPLERIATLDGIKLHDRGSCATFAVSARSGPPLAEQLPVLRDSLVDPPPLHHPIVRYDDRLLFDYGHFLPWARAAIDLVERRLGPPGATLAAVHRLLIRLGTALEQFAFEEGEPDRARDAALAGDPAELFAGDSPGLMREGAEMLSVVAADLEESARGSGIGAAYGDRLALQIAETMGELRRNAIRISEGTALPPAAGLDDVLRLSLRQQLFGPRSLIADRPLVGLLRMCVVLAAAVHGGRDFSLGHSLAARLLDVGVAQGILVQHEELAPAILAGMPLLIG